jgi:D-alanyl-D-alanine carboxypeptidase
MDVVPIAMALMLPAHAIGSTGTGTSRLEGRLVVGIRRVLAFVISLTLGASIGFAPAQADPGLTSQLDASIEAKIAEMGVPGAIVSLNIPGQISYDRAFGVADTATGAPMAIDDHTRIGSVTKTFTGTAILQLVDQGRIELSDPISDYVEGVPSGDVITLDLLGRMRSGLPDYSETSTFLGCTPSCPPVRTRSAPRRGN